MLYRRKLETVKMFEDAIEKTVAAGVESEYRVRKWAWFEIRLLNW